MKAFPRDVEVKTMKVRHIGIESELGIKRGDAYAVDISDIEAECKKRGLLQNVGYDGGGREFRTNPISVRSLTQVRGHKYLMEYYEVLKKNTEVLTSGGTHIHVSILNTDHESLESNATAMAIAFYEQFQKISGRKTHWAYRDEQKTLDAVRQVLDRRKCKGHAGRRTYFRRGSMLSPTHHQTFEFRGPRGSNDCEEILAWVEFLGNVMKACNRKSIEGVEFKQLLKGKRIEAYVSSLKGWRKLTKRELEQKFDGHNLNN